MCVHLFVLSIFCPSFSFPLSKRDRHLTNHFFLSFTYIYIYITFSVASLTLQFGRNLIVELQWLLIFCCSSSSPTRSRMRPKPKYWHRQVLKSRYRNWRVEPISETLEVEPHRFFLKVCRPENFNVEIHCLRLFMLLTFLYKVYSKFRKTWFDIDTFEELPLHSTVLGTVCFRDLDKLKLDFSAQANNLYCPSCLKYITHFKSGRRWLKKYYLTSFIKAKSKSPIHSVTLQSQSQRK